MDVTVRSATDAAETLTENDCAVVIDALRASATAIALLEVGAKSVIPVAGDGADRFGEDVLKVGEHHGERIAGFDLGNSPTEVRERADLFENEDVVLRTTNGTRCVERVDSAGTVVMGSLLNAEALVETCRDRLPAESRVVFVPAGRRGDRAPEDTYTAVALARRLQAALGDPVTASAPDNDMAEAITDAGTTATAAPAAGATSSESPAEHGGGTSAETGDLRPAEEVFVESDTGRFLASKNWSEDVRFCAQENVFEAVPVLEDGRFVDGRPTTRSATAGADGARGTAAGSPDSTEPTEREPDTSHLDDVDPSCGCVGVWEHLSEQRSASGDR
jgi:2-phosphosulfolactate phosphatase